MKKKLDKIVTSIGELHLVQMKFKKRGMERYEPANGNGKVKQRQHLRPRVPFKEVGKDGRSNGRVAGLSDADQSACGEKKAKVLRSKEQLNEP